MSEHDPLHALSGLIDDPVAPRPAFAEELRSTLLAELSASERNQGKERSVLNLTSPGVVLRLPESRKRTSRQRLVMALEIAAVAALMIGLIAALSPDRWGRSDPPTPASNSIQAMVPSNYASPEATAELTTSITVQDGIAWEKPGSDYRNPYTYGTAADESQAYRLIGSDAFSGVEAFDGATGDPLWQFPMVRVWPGNGVAAGDGMVFASGAVALDDQGYPEATLYALDRSTGAKIWALPFSDIASPPVLVDGVLYLSVNFNSIVAVNAADGSILWQKHDPNNTWLPRFWVLDGRIYLTNFSNELLSFDAKNPGSIDQITQPAMSDTTIMPPVIVDGKLIVSRALGIDPTTFRATKGDVTAFDLMNANTVLWTREFDGPIGAPVVLNNALVLAIPSTDGTESVLVRLDADSGETIWTSDVTSAAFGTLAGTTDPVPMILAPSAERILYGIDPETGKRIAAMGEMPVRDMTSTGFGLKIATLFDQSIVALLPYPGQGAEVEKPTGEIRTANLPEGVIWEKPLAVGQYQRSSTVVENGVVVRAISTSTFTGLEGIDPETGQQLWQQQMSWIGQLATGNGLVFVSGTAGKGISAIDPLTGETRWNRDMVGNASFPAYRDGVVYAWSTANMVFAIDADTGEDIWRAFMAPDSASIGNVLPSGIGAHTPAIGESVVAAASSGGKIFAYNRASGTELWTHNLPDGANVLRYAVTGNTLVVQSGKATEPPIGPFTLEGVDLATGKVIWTDSGFGDASQQPVVVTNPKTGEATVSLIAQEVQTGSQSATPVAIPASNTGIVFTLDAATGEIVKQSQGTNFTAIASTDDGTGLLLWPLDSRSTNQPIDLGQPIDGLPVKAGETIYVTLTDGTLVAIDSTKFAAE